MSVNVQVPSEPLSAVPLTLEGSAVLHQIVRFRWPAWKAEDWTQRERILEEAHAVLAPMEATGLTACYSLLGYKGDLMLVHFRDTFDELNAVELKLKHLQISDYTTAASSFVSVVELGLYESSVKTFQTLAENGVAPHTPEWDQKVAEVMERQREAMRTRLYPKVPPTKYACFYPMNRKRGERRNWYTLPIEERQRQMHDHGMVGRRYASEVRQIISGAIGFDDWEWGVDLFANDPLVFKKLIYEMRFDEASAWYAEFGPFYVGLRCPADQMGKWVHGEAPQFTPPADSI